MPRPESNATTRALAVHSSRELSDSKPGPRSVRSASSKHWQPPEGLSPEEVRAVIAAATCERDRFLRRALWTTGARISEVLALRPMDVHRDSLVLPNRKNPNQPVKRVFLPGAELGLTGELLLFAREHGVADDEPLFFSRKRNVDGSRRALQRGQVFAAGLFGHHLAGLGSDGGRRVGRVAHQEKGVGVKGVANEGRPRGDRRPSCAEERFRASLSSNRF